jgi:hypothetical protein
LNLGPGFYFNARLRGSKVVFSVKLPVNSWIGFTLGKKTMRNVDMVVFKNVNGRITVEDRYSTGYRPTEEDVK